MNVRQTAWRFFVPGLDPEAEVQVHSQHESERHYGEHDINHIDAPTHLLFVKRGIG